MSAAPATPPQRVIDLKLPLSWLIGSACVVIGLVITVTWNASAQTKTLENKIDLLINNGAKMEKRFDDRDVRLDSLAARLNSSERATDKLESRVDGLERVRK